MGFEITITTLNFFIRTFKKFRGPKFHGKFRDTPKFCKFCGPPKFRKIISSVISSDLLIILVVKVFDPSFGPLYQMKIALFYE